MTALVEAAPNVDARIAPPIEQGATAAALPIDEKDYKELIEEEVLKAEEEVHLLQAAMPMLNKAERLEAFSRLSQLEILVEQLLGEFSTRALRGGGGSSNGAGSGATRGGGTERESLPEKLLLASEDSTHMKKSSKSSYRDADQDAEVIIDELVVSSKSRTSNQISPILPDTNGYRAMLSGSSPSPSRTHGVREELTLEAAAPTTVSSGSISPERSSANGGGLSPTRSLAKAPLYRRTVSGGSGNSGGGATGPPPVQVQLNHKVPNWGGGGESSSSNGSPVTPPARRVPSLALESAAHAKPRTRVVMVNSANFKPLAQSLEIVSSPAGESSSRGGLNAFSRNSSNGDASGSGSPTRRTGTLSNLTPGRSSLALNQSTPQSLSKRGGSTGLGLSGGARRQLSPPKLGGTNGGGGGAVSTTHTNHVAIAQLLQGMKNNRS